uniref:Uncharacterized protein n=1 Tax=Anopheles minimus TaxID=112268 RepID=A0A182W5C8_9DIPT
MENQGANEVEPIDPTVCVVCKLPLVSRCKYCRRDDHRGVCDYTVDEVQVNQQFLCFRNSMVDPVIDWLVPRALRQGQVPNA